MDRRTGLIIGWTWAALGMHGAACAQVVLKEDHQVLQRDERDFGACRILIANATAGEEFRVHVLGPDGATVMDRKIKAEAQRATGAAVSLGQIPTGGPYVVEISPVEKRSDDAEKLTFADILVGDLWVTGGQSNMFGAAPPEEDLQAIPGINLLDSKHTLLDAHWTPGKPPIHRVPADKQYGGRIGPAFFFARRLFQESGVPIGLIPCAVGGSLAIWDPEHRAENRYAFMEHHVKSAGGRIRGLIWCQGEQDAIFGNPQTTLTKPSLIYPTSTYGAEFKTFVEAMRRDFGDDRTPVIFTQISRQHYAPYYAVTGYEDQHVEEKQASGEMVGGVGWERIREEQRLAAERIPDTRMVPTIDVDQMDGLHTDYKSQQRVGEQMAWLALPYVKSGVEPREGIQLKSVRWGETPSTILVEFEHVSGKLLAAGRPTGFELRARRKATGEGELWIYQCEFDSARPNVVILHVSGGAPRDGRLYYGPGAAPYVNIVDENGMSLPAFGPVDIEE